MESSSENWQYLVQRWTDDKAATNIYESDIKMQLLECCDESLKRDLHRSDKTISSKSKTSVLSAIKRLAVREENTMVSRNLLQSMQFDCGNKVNFTDEMVRDTLIWEFRRSRNSPRYSRAWNPRLVEAKKSGSLLGADKTHGYSYYKKGKKYPKGAKRSTCTNCGEPTHEGGNSLENRKKHCKAFSTKYNVIGSICQSMLCS